MLVHTLLSAVGKAGFGCEAIVKVGPLQLKPGVVPTEVMREMRATAVVALSLLQAVAPGPVPSSPSGGDWLALTVHASGSTRHEYVVPASTLTAFKSLREIHISTRGPRPTACGIPPGWQARVARVRGSVWKCKWRTEWTRGGGTPPAPAPVEGFALCFERDPPQSWCDLVEQWDAGFVSVSGPDAVPIVHLER